MDLETGELVGVQTAGAGICALSLCVTIRGLCGLIKSGFLEPDARGRGGRLWEGGMLLVSLSS